MVHGSPLVVELSDVVLHAAARLPQDWEEGPAVARERAAKQVSLRAVKASWPVHVRRGASQRMGGGKGWPGFRCVICVEGPGLLFLLYSPVLSLRTAGLRVA